MLYSYLLTRTEFKIQQAPESRAKDKRFAYALYQDLLLLILEMSGYNVQGPDKANPLANVAKNSHLSANRLAKALANDSDIKELIAKGISSVGNFDEVVVRLYPVVVASAAFRDYSKKRNPEIKDDMEMWRAVINTVILREPLFEQAARLNPDFTLKGFELAVEMLTETLSSYTDVRLSLESAKKSLLASLDKAYELYHALLLLPVEITKFQAERLEEAKNKYLPTDDDLNPNTRFVDNKFVAYLEKDEALADYFASHPFSWESDFVLIKELLDKILQSDIYAEYMAKATSTFGEDCEFWRDIFRKVIFPSDELLEAMESRSVYWNDDLNIMGTFVLKTIRSIAAADGAPVSLLPQYKDMEDEEYGPKLFMYTVKGMEEYQEMIFKCVNSSQWDPERLAFMDMVIMMTAIAELLNFPTIPTVVTINEYVEIANYYSTPKSGQFINGILFTVINNLKSEGRLLKD
ncbi:MAG: transcription antitermination protein NusB [Pseudoflavonifractor sp.]|nr:transcription antitermination protein NusB [Pseudoflavonifractor sp.]